MIGFCVRFLFCAALVSATCASAVAHPLGNFTINHLVELRSERGTLHVRYVIDRAEIPTFQLMRAVSNDAAWTGAQLRAWAAMQAVQAAKGITITVDNQRMPLHGIRNSARLRPGAAGLPTLYWNGDYVTALPPGAHHIAVADRVFDPSRVGWKDIVIAPHREPTRELLAYPPALIASPRSVESAAFDVAPDGAVSHIALNIDAPEKAAAPAPSLARSNALSDMFANRNRAPLFLLLTALVAFGLGALHALEPGHGKALLAFALVGSKATIKQAAFLAASLTFAHTIGVLLLGTVLFFAAGFATESVYSWIALLSGVAVALIGARNLARSIHGNSHHHDYPHPGDVRAGVIAAMSGGVAPCPAAIVVMLAALRLHQIGYGIALIVIFSLGLASVLTAIGIAVVHGAAWAGRSARFERAVAYGPLVSATLISIVGAVMVGQGFVAQGVGVPAVLVAAITALAIAGYALASPHSHAHPLGES
jgi:nickel/cobalt transporter (NicO) family protein